MITWTLQSVTLNTIQSANLLFNMKQSITPANNPNLWYNWYEIIKEDAPELCDQFIENTAAKMELTVDYFTEEFL